MFPKRRYKYRPHLLPIHPIKTVQLVSQIPYASITDRCGAGFVDCSADETELCIPHHKVCDGQIDCPGGLDEISCGKLASNVPCK